MHREGCTSAQSTPGMPRRVHLCAEYSRHAKEEQHLCAEYSRHAKERQHLCAECSSGMLGKQHLCAECSSGMLEPATPMMRRVLFRHARH